MILACFIIATVATLGLAACLTYCAVIAILEIRELRSVPYGDLHLEAEGHADRLNWRPCEWSDLHVDRSVTTRDHVRRASCN